MTPTSVYLEEEISKNVEFPHDGKFTSIGFGRYRVCGDSSCGDSTQSSEAEMKGPSNTQLRSWPLPRAWMSSAGPSLSGSSLSGPSPRNKRGNSSIQPYTTYLKKSIPFVSLCLDDTSRNILVDSTISNVYIKVPENCVSVQSILTALATKITCEVSDLVMLDVKFLEITDDKGQLS